MARAWRDGDPIAARLFVWLTARLAPATLTWLQTQGEAVAAGDQRALYTAFARAPRLIPLQDLRLGKTEAAIAGALVPGFDPCDWSLDQTARTWLLLVAPTENPTDYAALLDPLFCAADMRELIALCQSLPLLPYPAVHLAPAQAAVRSNMSSVFAAVALHNPYPAANFAEPAWNQMILKALFIGVPLAQISGLDARANPRLTRMLVAYARERRAADRPVPDELWQASAPYLAECDLDVLRLALESENGNEQKAAVLAMAASPALQRCLALPALTAKRTH